MLVNAVQGKSAAIRFTAGYTRTRTTAEGFCAEHALRWQTILMRSSPTRRSMPSCLQHRTASTGRRSSAPPRRATSTPQIEAELGKQLIGAGRVLQRYGRHVASGAVGSVRSESWATHRVRLFGQVERNRDSNVLNDVRYSG